MANSSLVISLDFELMWGVFDTIGARYTENLSGALEAVPLLLELFAKNEISATWASVGLLGFTKTELL